MRWAALLLLVACKTSHALEVHQDTTLRDTEHVKAEGEKHEGPWTETVWEYGNAASLAAPAASLSVGGPIRTARPEAVGSTARKSSEHPVPPLSLSYPTDAGNITRITVRTHGATDSSWQASVDGAKKAETTTTLAKRDESAPALSCASAGLLWALAALAGVVLLLRLFWPKAPK